MFVRCWLLWAVKFLFSGPRLGEHCSCEFLCRSTAISGVLSFLVATLGSVKEKETPGDSWPYFPSGLEVSSCLRILL